MRGSLWGWDRPLWLGRGACGALGSSGPAVLMLCFGFGFVRSSEARDSNLPIDLHRRARHTHGQRTTHHKSSPFMLSGSGQLVLLLT